MELFLFCAVYPEDKLDIRVDHRLLWICRRGQRYHHEQVVGHGPYGDALVVDVS